MQITKQYIKEKLLNKKGSLNSNLTRKLNETSEELYLIYNRINAPKCSGNNKAKFKSFTKGYFNICGDMTCQCYKDRYKRTQEKLKQTNLEKYGVEHYHGDVNKRKETCLKKYGNENYNNPESISETLLNKTDEENFNAHEKSKKTRLEKYGDKTYRNGKKCKQTKLDKYGSETYNNADVAQVKKRKSMEELGNWIPLDKKSDWELYKLEVRRLTEKNYILYKNEINPKDYKRVLCGEEGHQLDHITSVQEGFNNNINPKIISDKNNLQMLTWEENRNKWA